MKNELAISFPHMGDYHVPIRKLLQTLFPEARVFPAPAMTKKTVELGSRYSPEYVCSPFKYNMGNYIEALEAGANVLVQTGMGCRYGYYGEVQEQILRDMGYDFQFLCFSREKAAPGAIYSTIKQLGSPLSIPEIAGAVILAVQSIRVMDSLEYQLREKNTSGSADTLKKRLLSDIEGAKSLNDLSGISKGYSGTIEKMRLPGRPLRVGIVGELYTVMEPFSNFYVEKQLSENNISVSRAMNVSFLLFGKHDRATLRKAKGYLKYTVGANGVDSVAQCRQYAEMGYDGIIHMKSFGCTPELNAMPALMNLGKDYGIPILHLSFDTHTGETGLQTRIEAFCDMISMKRDNGEWKKHSALEWTSGPSPQKE